MNSATDLRPTDTRLEGIAVIGMSCRFPGARTPAEYWENLRSGRESISFFTDEELRSAGISEKLLNSPNYVKAAPVLDDFDKFDAEFFKCSPKEAAAMDPQHRFFLECAWEALEDAGYDPLQVPNRVGVYAGALINTYLLANIASGALPLSLDFSDFLETLIAGDKDFLATRTSYKLNLKGPSITVQTACSTSLVAVHLACQSLLNGECETALAGAVSIRFPHRAGYTYNPGGLVSPDGHCRPFSDRSQGTVFGSGVGVVVLKRLEDALADGDSIHAVIRGTAVNNDGSSKMSYTAPAVDGHAEAVTEALAIAGVDPATVGYIETHGTATDLGDPIEFAALKKAFEAATDRKQFCALGSVKSNLGHLDAAAGMAGLIKAVMALKHGAIPATLHFNGPNPKIDLASSPFFINTALLPWNPAGPRRAGVSSLGVGGTNAHAVLEEAPAQPYAPADDTAGLLVLSARSEPALKAQAARYRDHLLHSPGLSLADVCFTAAKGRRHFDRRAAVVAGNVAEAAAQLAKISLTDSHNPPRIAFLFSGQGSQYAGMAQGLSRTFPVFRESLERAEELTRPFMDRPLSEIISSADSSLLGQTVYAQPAILAVDLALYDLWESWGVAPAFVIGHSLGEYAAATVAGVFRREDAFRVVCERARLMQSLPDGGAMMAIRGAFQSTFSDVEIAAVNSPDDIVIAGPREAVLRNQGAGCKLLAVSHAFHSRRMEPILPELERLLASVKLSAPRLPIVSNLTGQLAGPEMADPAYWREHARHTVRFAEGMKTLHGQGCNVFLEAGPGSALLGFGANCLPGESGWHASIRRDSDDGRTILESLGRLYARGADIDWSGFYRGRKRRRISLPTYPFEGKRHNLQAPLRAAQPSWLYNLQWKAKAIGPTAPRTDVRRAIIVPDGSGLAARLRNVLTERGIAAEIQEGPCEPSPETVIYLGALDIATADFSETEQIIADLTRLRAPLWIVTRGAHPIRAAVLKSGLFQSALNGLASAIGIERPDNACGVIDLDPEGSPDEAHRIADEILSNGAGESRIAYRGGDRLVCRLAPAAARPRKERIGIDPNATYLITGGTGGIGASLAKRLADRGARHVVLTSSRGISAESGVVKADVANRAEMQAVLRNIESSGHPLKGVFHLAGVMEYEPLESLSALKKTLRPKAEGAWILHELTRSLPLDFFVLFSSVSSILPGPEMGSYAASNAFLDALAHYRRSAGLPALSVNWGPWSGKGMGEARASERLRSGVALMDPAPCLEHLESLMNSGATQAVLADIDWSLFRPLYESRRPSPLLEDLSGAAAPKPAPPAAPSQIARLRSATPLQQRDLLQRYVQTQVFTVLGIDPAEGMDSGTRLFEAGLDSLRAIELRNKLQSDLGHALPATLTLNHPTIEALAGFLAKTLPYMQPKPLAARNH
jgi:acyl transferase domain-containing protein/acyl carrier protein